MRTCTDEDQEFCGGCGDCDDGRCAFCGSEDCDGSGYNCEDFVYQEYNEHDDRLYAFDEDEADVPVSGGSG